MKNYKVLVFGATGLLGKPVARRFQQDGSKVRAFVRSEEKFKEFFDDRFEMSVGDISDKSSIENAMEGCTAVHISLSNVNDGVAAESIVEAAKKSRIELISLVSGSTVSKENSWFWLMKQKYDAEQQIINSGIPYIIFRPSWFYDTLARMVRKGRASVIGKQLKKFHWMAAEDFAEMVLTAFNDEQCRNKAVYCFGPEVYTIKEALEKYCKLAHPEIRKVGEAPVWLMKLIAFLSGNNMLKMFTELSVYFTKVDEPSIGDDSCKLPFVPQTTMEEWVSSQ